MMDFTDKQKEAIDYRENRSAIVSASAGSGKTAVLVEHIAKLISDKNNPVYADRIAAVTFTEKAAGELKTRLEARMERLIAENPDDDFYREQAVRLSFAQISTISSFCLSIVKDNIRLLPLEEGISVINETKSSALSSKAEKCMLKRMYTDPSIADKSEISRLLGNEGNIVREVKNMYSFFCNLTDPEGWINNQLKIYSDEELFSEHYRKPYTERILKSLSELIGVLQDTVNSVRACIIEEDVIKKPKDRELNSEEQASNLAIKSVPYFSNLKNIAESVINALNGGDLAAAIKASEAEQGTCPAIGKNEYLAQYVQVKDRAKEEIKALKNNIALIASSEEDRLSCAQTLKYIYCLEKIYEGEYSRLKREEKALEFSDLERFALEAVKKGASRGRFDYIIVDEFQDSNDIQYEIFKLLSQDEKNLYFVGDEKQCIYAFRNANPEIFTSLCQRSDYRNIKLNTNFRSSADVINTVNLLFSADDKPSGFSKNPWEDMICGRKIDFCGENKCELIKVFDNSDELRELKYVAMRIKQMIADGFTVHEFKDGEERERPCSYGDFAVLFRKNDSAAELRKIMEECGIPSVSVGEKDFTNLMEVEQAMAVLSAVVRPNDNISVVKALMCPAYGFTAEETAQVRLAEGTDIKTPLNSNLYHNLSKMDSGADDALHKKIRRFLDDMKLLRKESYRSTTSQLIRKIYKTTALDQIMSVGLKGKERLANMRLLVRYARDYPRPSDFLTAMKNIRSSAIALPQAQLKEQEEKSVKLMTVHASKGLQFPIVFLADTNRAPNKKDMTKRFIYHQKEGVGIAVSDYEKLYRYPTLSHGMLSAGYYDRLMGEELRLLYVALTRAEEKLIITATAKITSKGEAAAPATDSYFEFISKRLGQAPAMMNMKEIGQDVDIVLQPAQQAEQREADLDFELIKEKLSYIYPYETQTTTPAKFSATALGVVAAEEGDENTVGRAFYLGLPLFIKKDKPLTPKERGDLYHKVMENLDFSSRSAEEELKRLTADGTVTERERGEIKTEEIQGFLNSSLCARANKEGNITREFPIFTTVNLLDAEVRDTDDLSFIQGIADMFFVEKGEIVLVDYKTNRNTSPEKLTREYKGQLEIYKKALEEMTDMRVKECWLYSFSLGQCIRVGE